MTEFIDDAAPQWAERFLEALREGQSIRAAIKAAGVASSTVYDLRERDSRFSQAWRAALSPGDRRQRQPAGARRKGPAKFDRFLAVLAETSNVAAAATAAGVTVSTIYARKREDREFCRNWFRALAEGYDGLEIELLERLRAGESTESGTDAASGPTKKFDTATALRCLTAHRESMAREHGRRTLADEVTTIETINAKIDAMRLRQETTQRAIGKVRAAKLAAMTNGRTPVAGLH